MKQEIEMRSLQRSLFSLPPSSMIVLLYSASYCQNIGQSGNLTGNEITRRLLNVSGFGRNFESSK